MTRGELSFCHKQNSTFNNMPHATRCDRCRKACSLTCTIPVPKRWLAFAPDYFLVYRVQAELSDYQRRVTSQVATLRAESHSDYVGLPPAAPAALAATVTTTPIFSTAPPEPLLPGDTYQNRTDTATSLLSASSKAGSAGSRASLPPMPGKPGRAHSSLNPLVHITWSMTISIGFVLHRRCCQLLPAAHFSPIIFDVRKPYLPN